MTANRLGGSVTGRLRGGLATQVSLLVDAVMRQDRWAMARRATGPLLAELLAGSYDGFFGMKTQPGDTAGLHGSPVVLMDNGFAVVIAPASGPRGAPPVAVTALLLQSNAPSGHWFVASLKQDELLDDEIQRRMQYEQHSFENDLDIIAAHDPLDERAAAVDWEDDEEILLQRNGAGAVTVGDARAEAGGWDRSTWHWLADECHTFAGLYLRGRHPELVREFPVTA